MPAYTTIPSDLDRPSITYAVENPLEALGRIRGLQNIEGLQRLVDLPNVSMAVEFVPDVNPARGIASSEIKISVELPDVLPNDGVGPQTIELAYSPAAALSPDGAWSLSVEQEIVNLGDRFPALADGDDDALAFKAKVTGITTETIVTALPRFLAASAEVYATGDDGPMRETVGELFRDIDNADFKVLLNTDIDKIHDAAAGQLANLVQVGTPIVAEWITPVPGADGAAGAAIGTGVANAIRVGAAATQTTLENGVSMPLFNLADGTLGPGRDGSFVLAHDAGSAVEFQLPEGNLLAEMVDIMAETPVDTTFAGRVLPNLRPVEDPLELVRFAANPAYNGGSEEVKFHVDRRQLDLGTSPWDLASDSWIPAGSGQPGNATLTTFARTLAQPEIQLAQAVTLVLEQNGALPPATLIGPSSVVGEPYGNQVTVLPTPGDTYTAIQLLGQVFEANPNATVFLNDGTQQNAAEYLYESGAGELELNFGVDALKALNDADGYEPSGDALAQRQNFLEPAVMGQNGAMTAITKAYQVVEGNQVLAIPEPLPSQHSGRYDLNGAQPIEAFTEIVRQEVEREYRVDLSQTIEEGRVETMASEPRPVEAALAVVRAAENGTGPPLPAQEAQQRGAVAAAPSLSNADSLALGGTLHTMATGLVGNGASQPLIDALRSGDTAGLRALDPVAGLTLSNAVDGLTGGQPNEVAAQGAEQAARTDVRSVADERQAPEPALKASVAREAASADTEVAYAR